MGTSRAFVSLFLGACELGAALSGTVAGLWTPSESVLYHPTDMREGEGCGERAWRVHNGLPPMSVGHSDSVDVPELGHEVKSLEGETRFRLGNESRGFVGEICLSLGERGFRSLLKIDQLDRIKRGEISSGLFSCLPAPVFDLIDGLCRPSLVLAEYVAMVLVLPRGWIMVPRCQYDLAFKFHRISSGTPRYVLREEYVKELIRCSAKGRDGTGQPNYMRPRVGLRNN